jgi:enoyl-CoA hydratase
LEIGLVNQVVPLGQLDAAVAKLCQKISSRGPVAFHMVKVAINNGAQANLRTVLDIEARCFSLCFGTQNRVEGTNAFLEKRKPEFIGQ